MSTETGARMATNDVRDGELVTTEPPAVTVVTTPAEDAVTATLGALLVGGSLADAWAHTNILNELESFFTPWHALLDRKSTRLNSSHPSISYAVFCLKKK